MMTNRDDERNLEVASPEPKLDLMMEELDQAQSDISYYLQRNDCAYNYWQSRWPNQSISGLKEEADAFPWPNASDARPRTVKQVHRDHCVFAMGAFRNARIQAKSVRPHAPGRARQTGQVSKLLQWEVNTNMRPNLAREVPLALSWDFGYGASVIGIEWHTNRRLEYRPLTVHGLIEWIAIQEQVPEEAFPRLVAEVLAAMSDPAQAETLAQYVQSLSPEELTRTASRRILTQLRQERHAEVPVPYVYESLPVWTARRIGVDIIFPGTTGDLQKARFTALVEPVTETELRDRVETADYDPAFVEAAIKQKGQGWDGTWIQRTAEERGEDYNAFEEMIQLIHFDAKVSHKGVPCLYRTIFSPAVTRQRRSDQPLYASHGPRSYKHGKIPSIELRFEREFRPILSSQGIPEQAYSWEQLLKTQLDGTADRAQIVLKPPMIVPHAALGAIRSEYGPGALMGVKGNREVQFAPLPPFDATPASIMAYIDARVERSWPLFGKDLDPELKRAYQAELAATVLGEFDLCYEQTFQLMQEMLPEQTATDVAGEMERPFQVDRAEIQGRHTIEATFDPRANEDEYQGKIIESYLQLMQFNQGGTFNVDKMARALAERLDPDLADEMVEDRPVAVARERSDEQTALMAMLNGIEPDFPQFGDHQTRMEFLNEKLSDPQLQARITKDANAENIWALLENRMKLHQDQIQQYQVNPGIGRAVGTKTFEKVAPQMALPA